MSYFVDETELYHHGILNQKWGIRRYQNPDGTLTELGRKRLLKGNGDATRFGRKHYNYLDAESKKKEIQRLVRTGNTKVLTDKKHRDDVSLDDLNKAVDTAKKNVQMDALKKDPKMLEKQYKAAQALQKMDTLQKKLGSAADVITKGSNLYNSVVRVTNSFGITDLSLIKDKDKTQKKSFKNIRDVNSKNIAEMSPEELQEARNMVINANYLAGERIKNKTSKGGNQNQSPQPQQQSQEKKQTKGQSSNSNTAANSTTNNTTNNNTINNSFDKRVNLNLNLFSNNNKTVNKTDNSVRNIDKKTTISALNGNTINKSSYKEGNNYVKEVVKGNTTTLSGLSSQNVETGKSFFDPWTIDDYKKKGYF